MAISDWRSLLREGFDYDLYANKIWLPVVLEQGSDEERAVLKHILAASTVWVTRLEGTSLTAMPDVPLENDAMDAVLARWYEAIDRLEFESVIDYKSTKGLAGSRCFGDIARHALNHGTYHRGQLRGMLGARGVDFPDTDFITFAYVRDGDV